MPMDVPHRIFDRKFEYNICRHHFYTIQNERKQHTVAHVTVSSKAEKL